MSSFRWKLAYLIHIPLETSRDALVARHYVANAGNYVANVCKKLIENGSRSEAVGEVSSELSS